MRSGEPSSVTADPMGGAAAGLGPLLAGALGHDRPRAAAVTRRAGRWMLLLELAMLAASLPGAGPVADGVRVIGLIVVGVVGALVVFVAAVFAVGILAQRQPPYPM
jgi:hypothetical protein